MSLNWDISKCDNYDDMYQEAVDGPPGVELKALTAAIIQATMVLDMGHITSENVEKFFKRLRLFETLHGKLIRFHDGSRFITLDEVRKHIGLRTNVPPSPNGKWRKRMIENFERELMARIEREEKEIA